VAASSFHGAKWVDDDSQVELIWSNARSPHGVITRADLLLDDEFEQIGCLDVTTPERTAFDLGRRGPIGRAESPKETWLRLLLVRNGYPRPRTQIPVLSPDGRHWYYLDMGWEDRMLAVEYDERRPS
jgi:hypothetical protein